MRGMRNILWLIPLLVLSIVGCNGECYENQNALPLASFQLLDSNRTVMMDSLRVYGIGQPHDSVLWDGGTVEQLYLPFRIDQDSTQYVFEHLRTKERDTVTFRYDRSPVLASYECGVSYVYIIRSITSTGPFIDSVACPDGEINNVNKANLIIFLHNE